MNILDDSMVLFAALAVIIVIVIILLKPKKKPDITQMFEQTRILTDREYKFYKTLKPVADRYGLQIFMKVRLADLLKPKSKEINPMWMECFNKIKAKHIDFALADDDTNIIVLIELDDRTHQRKDRIERDEFVNAVLDNTGYTLIRTYGDLSELENFLGG